MHVPRELYPIERALAEHLSHLRGPQRRGLALWVLGAVLAQSACQAAVLAALLPWAPYHALRQRLREWLLDGADKAVPCAAQVEVERCFAPLVRWVLGWWRGRELALAGGAPPPRDDAVALVVSVLYRGSAIPVAWAVLPGDAPGRVDGADPAPAAPPAPGRAAGLDGAGAGRPRPVEPAAVEARPRPRLAPAAAHPAADHDHPRRSGALPGRGPGPARRSLGRPRPARLAEEPAPDRHPGRGVDERDQDEPWLVVTDLPPDRVGVSWYALRAGVELGFRALQGLRWQWQRSRPTDPARVARHWLVLASLWVLAHGTRVEDARERGLPPARLRAPPASRARARPRPRRISLVRLGIQWLRHLLAHGRLWRRLWLAPEPWPQPPPGLAITVHGQGA